VRKYAKEKRLSRAVELLIVTDLPIKTIAADLGYRKPFDLARAFRKRYGFTPSRFRANCLHLMFTQTLPAEKTSKEIDMMFPSATQG
jgi:AraC-like DNA-binding protein